MSRTVGYTIRPIEATDFEEVRRLWKSCQFTIYKFNNEVMVKTDREAIVVAEDSNDQIIGVCSGINLSQDLAFIGQYVVREEYRGLGIGSALWDRIMGHIGSERNISLIADPPMYIKYKNREFSVDPLKSVLYFQGKPNFDRLTRDLTTISVTTITEKNVDGVIQYDRTVCDGLDRTLMIKEMVGRECNKSMVAINANNQVVGYCVICLTVNDQFRVEPLYADNQSVAEFLLYECCQTCPQSLDNRSWDSHRPSLDMADKLGLHYWKKAHLLFTKELVLGVEEKIFSPSNSTFFPF